ncbi:hypothetical protein SEA_NOSHOW_80 [Mycobacterium phage NoShow]|nr:hypothetical protein SEA_NOSHOW_80 [Mycobacterium phage NoShow]
MCVPAWVWYDLRMTTNTFRQYLGTTDGDAYVIRLRTRKGQAYRTAPVIARFDTYDAMLQAWDMCTTAEGMVNVYGTD